MAKRSVLIVGGGSAGWITASYMNAVLNKSAPVVDIALVESPNIQRVGVGEATVPTIRHVLQTIGVSERDFMQATDATFKQAIRFDNWLHEKDPGYYHPFDRRATGPTDSASQDWLVSDRSVPFAKTVSVQPQLCDWGLSPRMMDSDDYASPLPYAYHMDAEKFADFLMAQATQKGVQHHLDEVTEVLQKDNGDISAVLTASGQRLEADFFIDCTGFLGLLISKTLNVGLVDFSDYLLCDSAIAMRVPYESYDPGHIAPFTKATALSAGWKWDIALSNRRGTGYVYCSQFMDADEAEQELRQHEGEHCKDLDARQLKFYVGHREKFWAGNCIATGLAGGFIEPLESTGIYLIEFAAVTLCEHFPYTDDFQPLVRRFNQIMTNRYRELLEFINLHYCLTQRTDTAFWREVQKPERICPGLSEKLEFWKTKPPSFSDFDDQFRLFSHQSYEYLLYAMDFFPADYSERFGRPKTPTQVPPRVANVVNAAQGRLPKHEDWLRQQLG